MNKIKDFLVTLLIVVLIVGATKWTWDQFFPQTNVSQPKVVNTPVVPTPPATPIQPTWKSEEGFPGPSLADTQQMLGVNVVRVGTEFSCFNWRGIPHATDVKLAKGFVFTVHLIGDKVIVINGNDKTVKALGFTARYVDAYPKGDAVYTPEVLAEKESRHMKGKVTYVTDI